MFDLVNGIPVHVLVVHAVVVLLPLAAVGTVVLALVPPWRVRYGFVVTALAVAATAAIPVATQSGEQLQGHVGIPVAQAEHPELGNQLIWFAVPLVLVAAALWLLALRGRRAGGEGPGRGLMTAVAVLGIVVAVANVYQVYRVGDSGAKAVWEDKIANSAG